MSFITFERVALVLLLGLVLWQGRLVRDEHKYLGEMAEQVIAVNEQVEALDKKLDEIADREPTVVYVPTPSAALGNPGPSQAFPGAAGGAPWAGGGVIDPSMGVPAAPLSRKNKKQMPAVPGGQVMNRLYDAADRMAADEGWDQATYDQVSLVFEDSAATMMELYEGLQGGQVTQQQARDEALAVRDDATSRLTGVLGPDGLVRLRGYVRGGGM